MNERVLSSGMTFWMKFVFPTFWISIFGVGTFGEFLRDFHDLGDTTPPVGMKWHFLAMWVIRTRAAIITTVVEIIARNGLEVLTDTQLQSVHKEVRVGTITVRVDETSPLIITSKEMLSFVRVWLAGKVLLGQPEAFEEQSDQLRVLFECDVVRLTRHIDNLFKEMSVAMDKSTRVGGLIIWRFGELKFRTAFAKWMNEHPFLHLAVT